MDGACQILDSKEADTFTAQPRAKVQPSAVQDCDLMFQGPREVNNYLLTELLSGFCSGPGLFLGCVFVLCSLEDVLFQIFARDRHTCVHSSSGRLFKAAADVPQRLGASSPAC